MKIQAEQRTDLWKSDLDWPDYETYVFGTLQRLMPGNKIMQNVAMKGTLSGRSRQIDIVVDRLYEGTSMRVAIDCKCYKRKVNIKDVESFLGMLEDLGIRKGVLVTTKGYSKSAYNRAQNGSRQTELRIVSPERLSDFQHMGDAYAWVEPVAAIVSPPQGWVVDNEDTRPERMQFSMYPLGHTRDSAMRRGAFISGNIILKREANASIESIARAHEIDAIKTYPNARFKRLESPRLSTGATANPVKTLLRLGYPDGSESWPEFSLYIDHPKAVLVLVLQCSQGEDDRYLPSLIWVGEKAILTGMVDRRLERIREINGRIAVYWNKAKYVEVYNRLSASESWQIVEQYVEITQPLRRLEHLARGPIEARAAVAIQACEFITLKFAVQPERRIEVPGEGWAIPLWYPEQTEAKPRIVMHIHGLDKPAMLSDPESLMFFTSTRLPFSSDEWPSISGIDG